MHTAGSHSLATDTVVLQRDTYHLRPSPLLPSLLSLYHQGMDSDGGRDFGILVPVIT